MERRKILGYNILPIGIILIMMALSCFYSIGTLRASIYAGPGSPYYLQELLMPLIYGNPYGTEDYVQPYGGYGYPYSYQQIVYPFGYPASLFPWLTNLPGVYNPLVQF